MNFIIKKEDLGDFSACVSQIIHAIGICGFSYEDDFRDIVNEGITEFYISENCDLNIAFENLKNQVEDLKNAKNVFFFVSIKLDSDTQEMTEKLDGFYDEIVNLTNAENVFFNVYEHCYNNKQRMFLFVNK